MIVAGPNGAGKSTLLRSLAGLLGQTSGTIELRVDGVLAEMSESIHYVAHKEAQKAALTVRENLGFWAKILSTGTRGISPDEALSHFALSHCADLPVGYLSAGQRRRAALARLLIAPRPLWLLDEPATALDARSQKCLATVMSNHLVSGGMIIAATHTPLGLDKADNLSLGATT